MLDGKRAFDRPEGRLHEAVGIRQLDLEGRVDVDPPEFVFELDADRDRGLAAVGRQRFEGLDQLGQFLIEAPGKIAAASKYLFSTRSMGAAT